MNLEKLKDPIESKWRVQSYSKKKAVAQCIPYVDSRDVQNRLDDVCGPHLWQSDYKEVKGNVYAGIGIKVADQWIWKWDCGVESKVEKEKGEASDSFKRAAVKWGIARNLYEAKIQFVKSSAVKTDSNSPYPIGDDGKRIWDLTEYINDVNSKRPQWWDDAVDYIADGGDIEKVKAKYKLTKEQEKELQSV